jgi:hypothetical protein
LDFWFENKPSGNPASQQLSPRRSKNGGEHLERKKFYFYHRQLAFVIKKQAYLTFGEAEVGGSANFSQERREMGLDRRLDWMGTPRRQAWNEYSKT